MKKQVSTIHLFYTIIIALILIAFVTILAFGKNPDAGNQMNVAATVTSIILAVIAIIMTLADVAGQRQSISELKETAEKLKESNTVAQEMIENAINSLTDFEKTKESLIESAVATFKEETIDKLQNIQENGNNSDFNELIDELKKENSKLKERINRRDQFDNSQLGSSDIKRANFILLERYTPETSIKYDDFLDNFIIMFGRKHGKEIVKFFEMTNKITIENSDNGEKKVIINKQKIGTNMAR
ncbi:hypothetical protein MOC71_03280 [Bacillus vallismortis]|uniref:Uncharacterized protein n=1 Tax=Bacillus vallismortis TaxID=72361 RepID=A0AAP3CIW5_BACVA|nr:hypothetical protein [Bacillus vallismortis]MCY8315790.1 hypothetical protein [Bacillus vallismortis]